MSPHTRAITATHELFDPATGRWNPIAGLVRRRPIGDALRDALEASPGWDALQGRILTAAQLQGIVGPFFEACGGSLQDARGLSRVACAAGFKRWHTSAGTRYRLGTSGVVKLPPLVPELPQASVVGALRDVMVTTAAHGVWFPPSMLAVVVARLCAEKGAPTPDARGLAAILRIAGFERRRVAAGVEYRVPKTGQST